MQSIKRPSNLSDGAWEIMQAVWYNYDVNDSKEFETFDQFNFSNEDLMKYCQELHDKRYVFLEHDRDGTMYLYMLTEILSYIQY